MGFGKDGKGVIIKEDISQPLLTLASGALIFVQTGQATRATAFRMLKAEITAQVTGLTAGEAKEGFMLGLAHGDLSLAEVEAAIELNGPVKRGDLVNAELAMRPVWYVGRFTTGDPEAATFVKLDAQFTKRWTFGETSGWNWFLHNLTATALTTGSTVRVKSTNFGVWVGE